MEFFGLDIGSQNLKLAQVQKRGQTARLVAFGSSPAPSRGLLSEAEGDLTTLASSVKKLYQEVKVGTKNVVAALPEDKVFTKIIKFPKLSEKELKAAINWEAEQYIPEPLSEVSLDYQVVGQVKDGVSEKLEVFLVAAPKRLIEKTIKVLKMAGLNPVSLETEVLALSRSLIIPNSGSNMLVDFGARATDIAIVEGGQVVFTHSISTAGEALTRAVAAGLNLDPAQAEEYKKTYGIDPEKLEGKVKMAMSPVLDTVVSEMEKAVHFYQTNKQKTISQVILAGGTSSLPEIMSHLAQKLNLEIRVGDPFVRLEKDSEILSKIPAGVAPFYATAIGLALKDVD